MIYTTSCIGQHSGKQLYYHTVVVVIIIILDVIITH